MNKVFLSHSSNDKEYVQYIAEQFGRDYCVYDSMCFEAGMKNIDEIFREMDNTSSTKPITTYYEMHAQYATYIENDEQRALGFLEEGKTKFPDSSYVVRTLFDCSEYFGNLDKMKESLQILEKMSEDNKSIKTAHKIRTALFYAHQKKPKDFISNYINGIDAFDSVAKERLQKKVDAIFAHSK